MLGTIVIITSLPNRERKKENLCNSGLRILSQQYKDISTSQTLKTTKWMTNPKIQWQATDK